jgi:hypothetical protein
MPFVTGNMLQEIADEFETQWNFPNCVGAIDGKHVRIRCPQSYGSHFIIINPTSPHTFKEKWMQNINL